jgi:hypothetical protein
MSNSIEKVSIENSSYENLFNIGDRIQENKQQDVEAIVLQVCTKSRDIQFARKVNHLNSRTISQDGLANASNGKVKEYEKVMNVLLDIGQIIFTIGAAAVGGSMGLSAFSQAFQLFSHCAGNFTQANVTRLDYNYQRLSNLISEQTQQSQTDDREHEQDTTTIDRIVQTSQRSFELIASS